MPDTRIVVPGRGDRDGAGRRAGPQGRLDRPDLTRAISNALPDHLGIPDGAQIADLVDRLTAEALQLVVPLAPDRPGEDTLPPEMRLADGRSLYETPGGRLYATPEHVHTEWLLLAATTPRDGARSRRIPAAPAAINTMVAPTRTTSGVMAGPFRDASSRMWRSSRAVLSARGGTGARPRDPCLGR